MELNTGYFGKHEAPHSNHSNKGVFYLQNYTTSIGM